jgi:hypothetical protein
MTVLKLEGEGDDWRLHLNGDWSLAAMAQIEAQLKGLPDTLRGTLVCDWSRAEAPGIGPVWALLMRLTDPGTPRLEARAVIGFLGRIVMVLREAFSRPRALRPSSLARHIYETGITAIPIVSLIAFLISVIVAYLGAQQLSKFGADIFVVDLVTISVLREMGVLLTAIIVAGRSGSAFAAEIGAMQLNGEIDALRAMGMNPIGNRRRRTD